MMVKVKIVVRNVKKFYRKVNRHHRPKKRSDADDDDLKLGKFFRGIFGRKKKRLPQQQLPTSPAQTQSTVAQTQSTVPIPPPNPLAAIFAARSALLESDVGRAFGTGLRTIEQQLAQRGIERSGIGVGALLDFATKAAEQLVTGRQRLAEDIAQQQFNLLPKLLELTLQREAAGLQALASLGKEAQQQIIQASQAATQGIGGLAQLLALLNMPATSTSMIPLPPTPTTAQTLPPNW